MHLTFPNALKSMLQSKLIKLIELSSMICFYIYDGRTSSHSTGFFLGELKSAPKFDRCPEAAPTPANNPDAKNTKTKYRQIEIFSLLMSSSHILLPYSQICALVHKYLLHGVSDRIL
jgi:hypothetical protein